MIIKEKPERSTLVARPSRAVPNSALGESNDQKLVLRILSSRSFTRSARLSSFLKYICEMTFQGRESDLNEQKIGQAVFGRSPDYDSSADGIVRTQASRLRQRLDLYFEDEGSEEPVRVILPKGGYVPVFMPRRTVEVSSPSRDASPAPAVTEASSVPVSTASTPMSQMVPWILCALFAVALTWLSLRHGAVGPSTSPVLQSHPLWDRMFSPSHPTLEVPGDSGLVMYHRFNGRSISLNDYLLGEFRSAHVYQPDHATSPDMNDLRTDIANRRYTSIVDLDAAVTLAQIAQTRHGTLQVRYARDLRPNDLKNGNMILLGAFEANPWVELFEPRMNFILDDDYHTRVFTIRNKSPHTGEPDHWESVVGDPQRKVYGVVAYLSNLSGNGNALIVEGTAMAGTEAAWDFVSDDAVLLPFLKKIQHADGTIPHFELLLVTQNTGSSAVRSNVLSWRTGD